MTKTTIYNKIINSIVDNSFDNYKPLYNFKSKIIINYIELDLSKTNNSFSLVLMNNDDVILYVNIYGSDGNSVIGINHQLNNTIKLYLESVDLLNHYSLNDIRTPLAEKLNQKYNLNINPSLSSAALYHMYIFKR